MKDDADISHLVQEAFALIRASLATDDADKARVLRERGKLALGAAIELEFGVRRICYH